MIVLESRVLVLIRAPCGCRTDAVSKTDHRNFLIVVLPHPTLTMAKKSKQQRLREKEEEKRRVEEELEALKRRVVEEAPARGYAPDLRQRVAFRALPISECTLRALEEAKPAPFATMTAIQNACIPHALAGRDILVSANDDVLLSMGCCSTGSRLVFPSCPSLGSRKDGERQNAGFPDTDAGAAV